MSTTTYITIATVSTYVPCYNAHEETQVWFRRRRGYLTMRGIQRLLKAGCDETHGETWSGTVTRIERAVSA